MSIPSERTKICPPRREWLGPFLGLVPGGQIDSMVMGSSRVSTSELGDGSVRAQLAPKSNRLGMSWRGVAPNWNKISINN